MKDSNVTLSGFVKQFSEEKSVKQINITGACSKKYAVAVALLEGK